MRDDFTVDENGYTKDGYSILDPVSKKAMYLMSAIQFVILAVAVNVGRLILIGFYGEYESIISIVLAASFILLAFYLILKPSVFYDHYRYRIDDDKVEVRRGIFIITHTLVPIERIHQVEVSKGPIDRHFGLAGVMITTAGGAVAIEYLKEDVAESIASRLNESVVDILKQRD